MTNLPDLSLLIDADGYLVELHDDGRAICIRRVLVYPDNLNTNPRLCEWKEVLPHVKHKIINLVNRRHANRMVKIEC